MKVPWMPSYPKIASTIGLVKKDRRTKRKCWRPHIAREATARVQVKSSKNKCKRVCIDILHGGHIVGQLAVACSTGQRVRNVT